LKIPPQIKAAMVVLVLAIVLGLGWAKYSDFLNQGRKAPEGAAILNKIEKEGLPEFSIKDIYGVELNSKGYAGKIIILNFWASWCDPCVAEFPSLMKLIEKFKGDVVLFAISADHEEKDIHTFLKVFKVNSPNIRVAWDKDYRIAKLFGTYRLPESYIIGRDGKLIRKVAGVDDWATADAFEYFEHLLGREKTSNK
jgi:thiol-disulfide isomerase/thioredoxin